MHARPRVPVARAIRRIGYPRTLVFSIGLLLSGNVAAQATDATPLQGLFRVDLAYPQARGETQVSVSPFWARSDATRLMRTRIEAEYGLSDRWQLQVEATASSERGADRALSPGFDAVALGARRSWMGLRGGRLHLALGAGVELPIAGRGEDDGAEVESTVAVVRDVLSLHQLRLAASASTQLPVASIFRRDAAGDLGWSAHAAAFVPVGWLRASTELSWIAIPLAHGGDERHAMFTPGLTVVFPWQVELGAAVSGRLASPHRDRDFRLSATYEF